MSIFDNVKGLTYNTGADSSLINKKDYPSLFGSLGDAFNPGSS